MYMYMCATVHTTAYFWLGIVLLAGFPPTVFLQECQNAISLHAERQEEIEALNVSKLSDFDLRTLV